ncbi:MAG: hypothetical protein MUO24_10690, partial [Desulfobacterales bacterium]|nr:hypothetical protein [Desulfobacterales bacterium]
EYFETQGAIQTQQDLNRRKKGIAKRLSCDSDPNRRGFYPQKLSCFLEKVSKRGPSPFYCSYVLRGLLPSVSPMGLSRFVGEA